MRITTSKSDVLCVVMLLAWMPIQYAAATRLLPQHPTAFWTVSAVSMTIIGLLSWISKKAGDQIIFSFGFERKRSKD